MAILGVVENGLSGDKNGSRETAGRGEEDTMGTLERGAERQGRCALRSEEGQNVGSGGTDCRRDRWERRC